MRGVRIGGIKKSLRMTDEDGQRRTVWACPIEMSKGYPVTQSPSHRYELGQVKREKLTEGYRLGIAWPHRFRQLVTREALILR
jgi:hypothetical protein